MAKRDVEGFGKSIANLCDLIQNTVVIKDPFMHADGVCFLPFHRAPPIGIVQYCSGYVTW